MLTFASSMRLAFLLCTYPLGTLCILFQGRFHWPCLRNQSLLWYDQFRHVFFGINGSNITSSHFYAYFDRFTLENQLLLPPAPRPKELSNLSLMPCAVCGAEGSTPFRCWLHFFVLHAKRHCSIPRAWYFVNEPVMYGLPIVLNPTILWFLRRLTF